MRAFIDTNLFVYATYPAFPEHTQAKDFLKNCLEGSDLWFLSWSVVYEYLRVVTHTSLFTKGALTLDKAIENVLNFSSARNVEILSETAEHPKTLMSLAKETRNLSGNLIHDAHHVILMKEHDIKKIYTTDTDLHRFSEIEVVNPLKEKARGF